mmetsp:Transcript_4082/g.5383  ORF Transcript_4082/g.5383 Transcript_4082/m.5383 type:complete len:81 (-) Transcript_4082:494-736(-)
MGEMKGKGAIVSCLIQKGRVIQFSFHPECNIVMKKTSNLNSNLNQTVSSLSSQQTESASFWSDDILTKSVLWTAKIIEKI